MSVVGTIKEFNPQVEKFSTYYERVDLYFTANGIAANKQVPVFLTVIGSKTYALLEDYLAPAKPKSKTLQELKDILSTHFEPEPLLIAERFHFHKRNQKERESIMEFVAELRKLATRCKFGDYIDDALRDRFVCGLRKENIQSQLLNEKTLTFATAIEIALNVESAETNSRAIHAGRMPGVDHTSIHRFGQGNPDRVSCSHCGRNNHTSQRCKLKDASCHICSRKGHIATICRERRQVDKKKSDKADIKSHKSTKWLDIDEKSDDLEEATLFHVTGKTNPPIVIEVLVNGQNIQMELDTGAAVSLISEATKRKYFSSEELSSASLVLKTYTAESISVLGCLMVNVSYECQDATLPLYVIAGNGPDIIGRNWMEVIMEYYQAHTVCHNKSTTSRVI